MRDPIAKIDSLGEREHAITHRPYTTSQGGQAAERDERWHAALLARRRGDEALAALGLADVPAEPDGWCSCPPETVREATDE